MVEVYRYSDTVCRDLNTKEGGILVGIANSAAELEALVNANKGPFGYFSDDVALESFELALEVLGVDPRAYLA